MMVLAYKVGKKHCQYVTLDRYRIEAFDKAFQVVPKTLLKNSGFNINEGIATLRSKNNTVSKIGVNIKNGEREFKLGVYDNLENKKWAIKYTYSTAFIILKINQLIITKPAGGARI